MSKVTVNKLKLSLWQELLYLLFVMVIPIVVSAMEIFSSHSTPFKITFSSIGCLLITVILIRKFVFKSKIEKLQSKCVLDEHDYEIDVGNKDKIRANWARKNMIILAYHAIVMILTLILAWLFIGALADQLVKFKGAALIILVSCLIGIITRFVFYYMFTRKEALDGSEGGQTEQSTNTK